MRLARVLRASASGGAASWSRCSPDSESRQISSFLRLRSNPACNIEDGPPLSSLLGDNRSVSPEEALLHGSPTRVCSSERAGYRDHAKGAARHSVELQGLPGARPDDALTLADLRIS